MGFEIFEKRRDLPFKKIMSQYLENLDSINSTKKNSQIKILPSFEGLSAFSGTSVSEIKLLFSKYKEIHGWFIAFIQNEYWNLVLESDGKNLSILKFYGEQHGLINVNVGNFPTSIKVINDL